MGRGSAIPKEEDRPYSLADRNEGQSMQQHQDGAAKSEDKRSFFTEEGNAQEDGPNGKEQEGNTPPEGEQEEQKDGQAQDGLVQIGNTRYTAEQLGEALEDSQAKREWQKAHTQKDQSLAAQFKVVSGFSDLAQQLAGNSEAAGLVRDLLVDQLGDRAGNVFDDLLKFDPATLNEEKYDHELGRAMESNRESARELAALNERLELMSKHDMTPQQAKVVEDYADRVFEESEGVHVLTLEAAHHQMEVERREKEVEQREEALKNGRPPDTPDKTSAGSGQGTKKWVFFTQ